jgi:hypothetical protein
MLFGANCREKLFSCIQEGRARSSINELAAIALGGITSPSVCGAGIEAGRLAG